jgi:hypothetical protein
MMAPIPKIDKPEFFNIRTPENAGQNESTLKVSTICIVEVSYRCFLWDLRLLVSYMFFLKIAENVCNQLAKKEEKPVFLATAGRLLNTVISKVLLNAMQ